MPLPAQLRFLRNGRYVFAAVVICAACITYWLNSSETEPSERPATLVPPVTGAATQAGANRQGASASPVSLGAMASAGLTRESNLNFESAPDIYRLATDAVNANSPFQSFNGYLAAVACIRSPLSRDRLEEISNQSASSAAEFERKRSAGVILQRCAGFFDNDRIANLGLLSRLAYTFRGVSDFYFDGVRQQSPSDLQLLMMLGRGDWFSFGSMPEGLVRGAQRTLEVEPGSNDEIALTIAWQQVACDIGKDCSANSLSYLNDCVGGGECLGSWQASFGANVPSELRPKVSEFRERLAKAFLARDISFFGLVP